VASAAPRTGMPMLQACGNGWLTVTAQGRDAAMMHRSVQLAFALASRPCTLSGYPGVDTAANSGYTQSPRKPLHPIRSEHALAAWTQRVKPACLFQICYAARKTSEINIDLIYVRLDLCKIRSSFPGGGDEVHRAHC
jgi:hypothetical protein